MADEPRVEHAIVRRDVGMRLKDGEDRHRGPVFDDGQRQLSDGFHRFCATGGVLFKKLPIFPKAIGAPAAIVGERMGAIGQIAFHLHIRAGAFAAFKRCQRFCAQGGISGLQSLHPVELRRVVKGDLGQARIVEDLRFLIKRLLAPRQDRERFRKTRVQCLGHNPGFCDFIKKMRLKPLHKRAAAGFGMRDPAEERWRQALRRVGQINGALIPGNGVSVLAAF